MSVLSPMTELEAVNRMLASIGQAPVNAIPQTGVGDAAKASRQLTETARDVQLVGWSWNVDENYTLTPDGNGAILLPNGALDVDAMDPTVNVSIRLHPVANQLALYDQDHLTFSFASTYSATNPFKARVLWGFSFDQLPAPARSYVATAAARRFQAQVVSSTVLDKFNEIDEERAFLLLQRYERRQKDTNSFRTNRGLLRWIGRRSF